MNHRLSEATGLPSYCEHRLKPVAATFAMVILTHRGNSDRAWANAYLVDADRDLWPPEKVLTRLRSRHGAPSANGVARFNEAEFLAALTALGAELPD